MDNKKYRIGIDARLYQIPGGIGRYTRELIRALEGVDESNEYYIFLSKEGFDLYKPSRENFHKVLLDVGWYNFSEQLKAPSVWRKAKLDLMHFTHFNKSLLYRRPYVITIHDLTYTSTLRSGMKISKLPPIIFEIKFVAYALNIWDAIKRAKRVIVPSFESKEGIVKSYHLNPKKVVVTYESVTGDFSPDKKEKEFKEIAKKFGITKNYFIYVGNASPHKNIQRLIEGFLKFHDKREGFQLVLAGKKEKFYKQIEDDLQKRGVGEDQIILTDVISDQELYILLANSFAFVFPSLAEGFGIPPLEAMASGTPVLASKISCLPEICQDNAMYFDPYDTEDIAEKMHSIVSDEKTRKDLIERGFVHVKRFSWEKMARETLDVYKDVLNKRR